MSREVMYVSFTLIAFKYRWTSPTLGRVLLVSQNRFWSLSLAFTSLMFQITGNGRRTGSIAAAQLPLVILLAGKNNIIGCLTGIS